jgi:transcriptional regulator with XRE-family HTH domain
MIKLGQILKRLRGRTKQAEFAAELGVSQSTLSRYENDRRQPDVDFLMRIVERYNLPFNQLLHEGDKGASSVGEGGYEYRPVSDSDWVIEELTCSPALLESIRHLLGQKHGKQLLRAIGDLDDRQVTVVLGVVKVFQAK